MKRISDIANRLKEYRDRNDLTLSDMERLTGIPAQTINRYELGQRAPKIDIAIGIAESLRIDPLWLQGYDVSTQMKKPTPDESGLSEDTIELFKSLSKADQEIVLSLARQMKQKEIESNK